MTPYEYPPHMRAATRLIGWFAVAVISVLALILMLPAPALGQEVVAPPDPLAQLGGLAVQALGAPGAARWVALALVGVLGATWLVRRIAAGRTSAWARWVSGDEGGTVLGWVASAVGALAVHVIGGGRLSAGELGAVALGLRAGSAITWSDGRRMLRVLAPLVRMVPKFGPALAGVLDVVSGATAKAEINAATAAAYKPLDPAPDAAGAAAILQRPPVP